MRSLRWWRMALVVVGLSLAAAALVADVGTQPAYVDELGSSNGLTREAAVSRLASEPSKQGELLDLLEGQASALVKAGVAQALARMGLSVSDLAPVVTLSGNHDVVTRAAAVRILAAHASACRSALAARARDPDELAGIRAVAARGLGRAGSAALSDLRALLAEAATPPAVREAALLALAEVSEDGLGDVAALAGNPRAARREREVAAMALGQAQAIQALSTLAGAKEVWMREAALGALLRLRDTQALKTFLQALTDPAGSVRHAGLQGLVALGVAAAQRQTIYGLLQDADPKVQALAVRVTGQVSLDIATSVLSGVKGLLASASFRVRYEAALALLALHDKGGLTTMQTDAASANPVVAAQAAQAVTQIQNASW